jgi:hypothetical protein
MLVRVGNTEAEVKVAAVMSMPRLGFTDNFFCVASALTPHGISPVKVTGAYWGQSLQRAIESVVKDADWVLTIDYDTIFSAKTVEALMTLALWSGVDAIAPLQVKREANAVMFALPGSTPDEQTQVSDEWFKQPVQPVETAHFGLTLIRASALRATPKPWFVETANDAGTFDGGHMDADIHFWKQFTKNGHKLGLATHVSVGHAELMITWPSRQVEDCKVLQHTTDYWANGQKAPEKAWGQV